MKERAPATFEDMLEAPEGEWHYLPGGFEVEDAVVSIEADSEQIVVSLPARAIRAFRPKPRERFSARVARGKLIVERSAAKPPRRAARRPE